MKHDSEDTDHAGEEMAEKIIQHIMSMACFGMQSQENRPYQPHIACLICERVHSNAARLQQLHPEHEHDHPIPYRHLLPSE